VLSGRKHTPHLNQLSTNRYQRRKGHQAVSEVVHDEQIEALADLGGEFPHPDHDMMYPSPRDYTFSLNS
ncbi:hypothetical protein ADL35_12840, partial [Streptomyces sp. NRRL WC-3753]